MPKRLELNTDVVEADLELEILARAELVLEHGEVFRRSRRVESVRAVRIAKELIKLPARHRHFADLAVREFVQPAGGG